MCRDLVCTPQQCQTPGVPPWALGDGPPPSHPCWVHTTRTRSPSSCENSGVSIQTSSLCPGPWGKLLQAAESVPCSSWALNWDPSGGWRSAAAGEEGVRSGLSWGEEDICCAYTLPSHEVSLRIFGVCGTGLPPLKVLCSLSGACLLSAWILVGSEVLPPFYCPLHPLSERAFGPRVGLTL